MGVTKLPKCMKGTAKHRQGAVGVQSRDHGWWYSRSEIRYPLTSTVTRLTVLEYSFATGVSEEANSKRVDLSTAYYDFEEPDFITSASCLPGTTFVSSCVCPPDEAAARETWPLLLYSTFLPAIPTGPGCDTKESLASWTVCLDETRQRSSVGFVFGSQPGSAME